MRSYLLSCIGLFAAFLSLAHASDNAAQKRDAPPERFAGIWQGRLFRSGSGNTDNITVFVNPKKQSATVSNFFPGPQTGHTKVDGNTMTWKWMLATWTMTLNPDGKTATIDADSPLEACRGTLLRRFDH